MLERAPDVTRIIDRLEVQHLVERERSGRDRRLSITRISRKGLELLERMQRAVSSIHEELAARIPARDARELSRICEALYGDDD
jgi:DNA-binding MarR family transcriptional regulator